MVDPGALAARRERLQPRDSWLGVNHSERHIMPNAKQPLQFKATIRPLQTSRIALTKTKLGAKKISGRPRSGEDRKDSAVVLIWLSLP